MSYEEVAFKNAQGNMALNIGLSNLTDGHTIKETLYLNSIPKVWNLLAGILSE